MGVQEIDIRRDLNREPAAAWELLSDSSTWPSWTPIDSFELAEPGGPDGVGEVRIFHTGRIAVRERIVERVPERRLSYVLLAGLAVRDYRAEIDLTPRGAGSEIRWHTTFRAKFPGSGRLYRRELAKATEQFVAGLAKATAAPRS
jgi:uncharacterized protein YndB with AHSA1/START domain